VNSDNQNKELLHLRSKSLYRSYQLATKKVGGVASSKQIIE